jgi:hypothetical protein
MDFNELMASFQSNTKATNDFNKSEAEFETLLDHIRESEQFTDEEKEEKIKELTLRRSTMLQKEQVEFVRSQKKIKRAVIAFFVIIAICVLVIGVHLELQK